MDFLKYAFLCLLGYNKIIMDFLFYLIYLHFTFFIDLYFQIPNHAYSHYNINILLFKKKLLLNL